MDTLVPYDANNGSTGWPYAPSTYYYEITNGNNKSWVIKLEFSPYHQSADLIAKMEKIAAISPGTYLPEHKYRQAKKWRIDELNDIEPDEADDYIATVTAAIQKSVLTIKDWEQTQLQ